MFIVVCKLMIKIKKMFLLLSIFFPQYRRFECYEIKVYSFNDSSTFLSSDLHRILLRKLREARLGNACTTVPKRASSMRRRRVASVSF